MLITWPVFNYLIFLDKTKLKMKKILFSIVLFGMVFLTLSAFKKESNPLTDDFIIGDTGIASINALAFHYLDWFY